MAAVGPWLVAAFVAAILLAAVRNLRGGGSLRTWRTPDAASDWGPPVLGVMGLATIAAEPASSANANASAIIFGAIFGAACALLTPWRLKTLRDYLLSAIGVYATWLTVQSYVDRDRGLPAGIDVVLPTVPLVVLGIAFAVGILVNILRTFALPQLGIAMFGALEILVFLASPYGIDLIREAPVSVNVLITVVAGIVGFAIAAAPNVIVTLATVAIVASKVGVNVLLWVDAAQAGRDAFLDWSGGLMILGCLLAFGLVLALVEVLRNPGAHLPAG